MEVIDKQKQILHKQIEEIIKDDTIDFLQMPPEILLEIASDKAKSIVDDNLLSEQVRKAEKEGYIHINNKGYYLTKSLNNLQYPLDKILKYGFKAELSSLRPAKRIETAGVLTCIIMQIVQNEMHGGQSIPAFDYYLAPYVRMTFKEELNKIGDFIGEDLVHLYNQKIEDYVIKETKGLTGKEKYVQEAINNTVKKVYQSMEAFINIMNTIQSTNGNRAVFSTINYGTDTSAEGRCVIRQLLLATERGIGDSETPMFPIQVWKKKKGINYMPGDKNYDLFEFACKITAKRYYPNYLNLDATFNQNEKWDPNDSKRYQYECATMGCRTRVYENRFGPKTPIGRGNLSFFTINLPKIAIESVYKAQEKTKVKYTIGAIPKTPKEEDCKKQAKEIFLQELEKYADITASGLYDRYKYQSTAIAKQFPLLMSGLWYGSEKLMPDEKIEKVIKHGTLGIGFVGLAECLIALTGEHHGESEESQKLGLEIITKLSQMVEKYSEKYNLNYTLVGTSAQRIVGKFVKNDREKYGNLPKITDKEYYTNSNHVPVWYECSPEKKAQIEGSYHALTKGGHIFYIEVEANIEKQTEKIHQLVDLMDKYNLGYGTVNFPKSKCMNCGFEIAKIGIRHCPVCDSTDVQKLQRISGYLIGTTEKWNDAKLAELEDRIIHK